MDVADLVTEARALDPDRTLCVMLGEAGDRPLLLALVLLNAELARIPELVSEPLAGRIRYQWWLDSLGAAAVGGATGGVPLLAPLAAAFAAGRLDPAAVEALVTARETELDRLQPENLEALEGYLAASAGALHRLLAEACDGSPPEIEAAGAVGIGCALVGLVRALGRERARGLLPADLLAAEGVGVADILAGRSREALDRLSARLLERAEVHLARAAARAPFRRRVLPALLPARLARRQARGLAGARSAPSSRDAWTVPDLIWGWVRRRI
ncbi:MAG: squalene/phytoene synthase family protein [Geminicoccaceae bacterium]